MMGGERWWGVRVGRDRRRGRDGDGEEGGGEAEVVVLVLVLVLGVDAAAVDGAEVGVRVVVGEGIAGVVERVVVVAEGVKVEFEADVLGGVVVYDVGGERGAWGRSGARARGAGDAARGVGEPLVHIERVERQCGTCR